MVGVGDTAPPHQGIGDVDMQELDQQTPDPRQENADNDGPDFAKVQRNKRIRSAALAPRRNENRAEVGSPAGTLRVQGSLQFYCNYAETIVD